MHKDAEARREYMRKYRAENRNRIRELNRRHRDRDREEYNRKQARHHRRQMRARRRELIELLGGACWDCGLEDERVFQVHHANGGGGDSRREHGGYTAGYYVHLRAEEELKPGSLLLLCANCHAIRHWKEDDA
jgi:hypothetical protein